MNLFKNLHLLLLFAIALITFRLFGEENQQTRTPSAPEHRIFLAKELKQMIVAENGEPLVTFEENQKSIACRKKLTGDLNPSKIQVRQAVADKLYKIQMKLQKKYPNRQLVVIDGYRHPLVQEEEFLKQFAILARQNPSINGEELVEKAHLMVALPSVAGHPTGGAVDVTLCEDGHEIDMGGEMGDFTRPDLIPTFAQGLTPVQKENRLLLHNLMIEEGFAPFYGEWWHFSYGDREWAAFYSKPQTLYSPLYIKSQN